MLDDEVDGKYLWLSVDAGDKSSNARRFDRRFQHSVCDRTEIG